MNRHGQVSSVKDWNNLLLGKTLPCKSPGSLVNLSCWSCQNNYVVGGRSRKVASFLVWDTPGSPMGMQAACISCCSTSLKAASALQPLHKSRNGNTSSTGKALLGGDPGSWWTSQCSAWMSIGRGSCKALLGPCRDWPGLCLSHSPQAAAPAASPWQFEPHCAFCSTSRFIHPSSPWAGHTQMWEAGHPC